MKSCVIKILRLVIVILFFVCQSHPQLKYDRTEGFKYLADGFNKSINLQYKEAILEYEKAFNYGKKNGDIVLESEGIAGIYLNLRLSKDDNKADSIKKYYEGYRDKAVELSRVEDQMNYLIGLANFYYYDATNGSEEYEKAIKLYESVIGYVEKYFNKGLLSFVYEELAELYFLQNDLTSADHYNKKAIEYAQESNEYFVLGDALFNRGNYKDCVKSSYSDCLQTMQKAIEAYNKLGVEYFLISPYLLLSYSYLNLSDYSKAEESIHFLLDLSIKYDNIFSKLMAYKFSAELNLYENNYTESLRYYHKELAERIKYGDKKENINRCFEDIYLIHTYTDNQDSLAYYGFKIFTYYEKENLIELIIDKINTIMVSLYLTKQFEKLDDLIKSLSESISYFSESRNIYTAYENLGKYHELWQTEKDYKKAFEYFSKAFALDINDDSNIEMLLNCSRMLTLNQERDKAIIYLDRANEICKKSRCRRKGDILLEYSYAYSFNNDSLSFYYGEQALEYFRSPQNLEKQKKALMTLTLAKDVKYAPYCLEKSYELLDLVEKNNNTVDLEVAYSRLNYCLGTVGRIEEKMNYTQKELELTRINNNKFGELSCIISLLQDNLSHKSLKQEYEEELLNDLEKLISPNTEPIYLITVGNIFFNGYSNNQLAKKYYLMAIKNWNEYSIGNPFHYYAYFLSKVGDLDSSLIYYARASQIYMGGKQYKEVIDIYMSIGRIFQTQKFAYTTAKDYYLKCLEIINNTPDEIISGEDLIKLYLGLSICEINLGNYESAKDFARQGLLTNSIYRDNAYFPLAISFQMQNETDSLFYYIDKLLNSNAAEEFKLGLTFTRMEYALGQRDSLTYNETKERIKNFDLSKPLLSENSPYLPLYKGIQRYFNGEIDYNDYFEQAEQLAKSNLNFNDVSIVRKYRAMIYMIDNKYDIAFNYMDSTLSSLDEYFNQLTDVNTITTAVDVRSKADLIFLAGLATTNFKDIQDTLYLEKFVNLSELITSKATIIQILRSQKSIGDSYYFQSELQSLSLKINEVNKDLIAEKNLDKKKYLDTKRDSLYQEYNILNARFNSSKRNKAVEFFKPTTMSIVRDDILSDNDIVVKFVLNKDNSFAIAFDKYHTYYFVIPSYENLVVNVKTLRNFYQSYSNNRDLEISYLSKPAYELYEILLKPIEEYILGKNIIIIPDNVLYYLPFEMLVTDTTNVSSTDNFNSINFLVKKSAITYTPSLSLTKWLYSKENNDINEVLLVGKSNFGSIIPSKDTREYSLNLNNINDLPGVKDEIKGINEVLKEQYKVNILLNEEAKESRIKNENLITYKFIHFATHGIVDDESPYLNSLLLEDINDTTSVDDGFLQAFEISKLNTNADLVVLSACNTGLGKMNSGEGMIGLNQAFFIAGSKSLCLTLWSISDASTSLFMNYFYTNLSTGMTKREALRQAKLSLMSNEKYSSPYYWAPYILSGASD